MFDQLLNLEIFLKLSNGDDEIYMIRHVVVALRDAYAFPMPSSPT